MYLYISKLPIFLYFCIHVLAFSENINNTKGNVPKSIMTKLQILGAQVKIINSTTLSSNLAKYLIMDDKSIKTFLIRNPEQRISLQHSMLVKHWLKDENRPVLCACDLNKTHLTKNIVPGLFGARNNEGFHKLLGVESIRTLLQSHSKVTNNSEVTFIEKLLWPKLKLAVKCYDTNHVTGNASFIHFPVGIDFYQNVTLGTEYNAFEEVI